MKLDSFYPGQILFRNYNKNFYECWIALREISSNTWDCLTWHYNPNIDFKVHYWRRHESNERYIQSIDWMQLGSISCYTEKMDLKQGMVLLRKDQTFLLLKRTCMHQETVNDQVLPVMGWVGLSTDSKRETRKKTYPEFYLNEHVWSAIRS